MNIPAQVKEAANPLGNVITFKHTKSGYSVYSVGTPRDENGDRPPTGLPMVVLFKEGKATPVVGVEAFKWLRL